MVFSSYLFLFFFLPAVLACYYASPRKWKHTVLTLFSCREFTESSSGWVKVPVSR